GRRRIAGKVELLLVGERAQRLADRGIPEIIRCLFPLVVAKTEQAVERFHFLDPAAFATHEVIGFRVGIDERTQWQMEFGDVLTRELVPRGYAHRPRFAVQPAVESQRPWPAADGAPIGSEAWSAMTPSLQLGRR